MGESKKDAIPERSAKTQWLMDRLRKLGPDEVVTYEELSRACGDNVQGRARSNLNSARKALLVEDQVVYGCVREKGIKRLGDIGALESAEGRRKAIRRCANRARREVACITDIAKLGQEDRKRALVVQAWSSLVVHLAKDRTSKKLEIAVSEKDSKLNHRETLKALEAVRSAQNGGDKG